MKSSWIEVDRAGLAQVIADRPKSFILFELIQNSLDEEGVTTVEVGICMHPEKRGRAIVIVTDDSTDGYADIRHAWTMFAPSKKKGDAEKRGRFNLGCKTVLALAEDAQVTSTKSAVRFSREQGRKLSRERTKEGTQFQGIFRMSQKDVREAAQAAKRIIPPDGVKITINDVAVEPPELVDSFVVTLPTVFADDEGVLRNTKRRTSVVVYKPKYGETPTLFEMGIPVVEFDGDDPYHVDVQQRVPLNTDRDNVTPSYLRTLRVEVLNNVHDQLTEEQAQAVWATEASEDERCEEEAVDAVLTKRFGEKRVAYDPSDPEANKLAMSKGYTVIPGRSLTKGQWDNAKASGAVKPAGQVTPSPRVESSPGGVLPIDFSKYDDIMKQMTRFAVDLCNALEVVEPGTLKVSWYSKVTLPFVGAWFEGGSLSFNKAKMGHIIRAWKEGNRKPLVALLIHEFAHDRVADHLSSDYHEELCRLAAESLFLAPPQEV